MEIKKYYVYVYLNPIKNGDFIYGEYKFEYEPFYIGKGCNNRYTHHINENRIKKDTNKIKINLIEKLKSLGLKPIIKKIKINLSETDAYEMEKLIIDLIGKKIDGTGPLTNIKNGGDGFNSDDIKNSWLDVETREKRINGLKEWWSNLSDDERKEHSNRKKGESNPFFNKSHSIEYKKMRSEKYKGEGNPMYGKTGELSPLFGKKHSDETNNKKSESMKAFYSDLDEETLKKHNEKISNSCINNIKFCGENNGNNKLKNSDVIKIRDFYENNKSIGHSKTIKMIMDEYNMSYTGIDSIIKRKTWKNI